MAPRILVADVEKKLKPKIKFFQDLGLVEPHLGKFFSRNSALLTCSLRKLGPSIQFVKEVLGYNNQHLFKVFNRCNGFIATDGLLKLSRNIEYLQSCGIVGSQLSRKIPSVFRVSGEKLKLGIEFYINVAKVDKNVLVSRLLLLMSSLEDLVIPRYRVLQVIKSKKLLKTDPSFLYVLNFTENEFLKFMSRFPDDLEELLIAFKAHLVYTSSEEDEQIS
ncbi:hypothetical protein PTKIN_Ptkin08bG0154000 [Pterospermum kingtungense]